MSEQEQLNKRQGWKQMTLGDALPIRYGKARSEKHGLVREQTAVYGSSGVIDTFNRALTNGPTLIIGRKGTVGATHYSPEPCWPIDTVYFTEADADKDLRFFKYLLDHLQLGKMDRSTAVPGLSRDDYNAKEVFIPSLDEQREIVAEIEKQFTRLEAGVAGLRRVQANLKHYRAAVLKAACEGKLVPTEAELARERQKAKVAEASRLCSSDETRSRDASATISDAQESAGAENQSRDGSAAQEGPGYETGAQLLERILSERRQKWNGKGKYKEPVKPDTANLPPLPEGWVWTNLGQMFGIHVGATPSRQRSDYWGGTISWVSSGEVAFCRIRGTREQITDLGLAKSSTEIHPPGTVLIGMIGEGRTRGQVAILEIAACNNQNSAAIRVSDAGMPSEYTYYFLMGRYEKNRTLGSGNNQPALNKARVQNIPFPLPPLAEQHRIVAEVERRLSVVEELEAVVNANLRRATRLRQSILQRAFDGESRQPC